MLGSRFCTIVEYADQTQYSGVAPAHAKITAYSVDTNRQYWIYIGHAIRKYCFLPPQICTWRVGMSRQVNGYGDILDTRRWINCMDVSKRGEEMLVSGSDDGYIGVCALNSPRPNHSNPRLDLGHTNERCRNVYSNRFPRHRDMFNRGWE